MSGMKNYLVRQGEGELLTIVDEEREKVRVRQLPSYYNKKNKLI